MSDFNEYNFLCHHGIKGMKWGIRRYQNKDGSLTQAGKERYSRSKTTIETSLRKATEKDLNMIFKWELETINKKYRNNKKIQKMIRESDKENIDTIRIIKDGNKDIGIVQSYPIDNGEWQYLDEIYLIPEYRGKGIGSSLIKNEINKHDRLVLRVDTENTRAIELYKSFGFEVTENNPYSMVMRLDKTKR